MRIQAAFPYDTIGHGNKEEARAAGTTGKRSSIGFHAQAGGWPGPFLCVRCRRSARTKTVNGVNTTYIPHEKTLTHASAAMMSCTSFCSSPSPAGAERNNDTATSPLSGQQKSLAIRSRSFFCRRHFRYTFLLLLFFSRSFASHTAMFHLLCRCVPLYYRLPTGS